MAPIEGQFEKKPSRDVTKFRIEKLQTKSFDLGPGHFAVVFAENNVAPGFVEIVDRRVDSIYVQVCRRREQRIPPLHQHFNIERGKPVRIKGKSGKLILKAIKD